MPSDIFKQGLKNNVLGELLRYHGLHLARLCNVLLQRLGLGHPALSRLSVRDSQELVHRAHVNGELKVQVMVGNVAQQEQEVKTGQQCHRQINVL